MYYVYQHLRLSDNSIFYIGKGTADRLNSHIGRNLYWNRIVKKDGGFISKIIKDGITNEEACELEKSLIREIGLDNLANLAEGGNGGDTRKGFTKEEYDAWIENKSKAQTGKTGYWKDRKRPEHSEKLKEAGKRGAYKNNGKAIRNDDWKHKQSLAASTRIRKLVICELCGKEIPETHLGPHQRGKKCIY
jgi:hypothetical protein